MQKNNLTPVEHCNQRILTTKQIADAYGAGLRAISNNFNRNKERYVEGKHYYCLEGVEKRDFLNHHQFDDGLKKAAKLYLWTERGALLHAKSLNTDRAWEMYDQLVEHYFRTRHENPKPKPKPFDIDLIREYRMLAESKEVPTSHRMPLLDAMFAQITGKEPVQAWPTGNAKSPVEELYHTKTRRLIEGAHWRGALLALAGRIRA